MKATDLYQFPYALPRLLYWGMALFILTVIYQDFALGGHEWKQGDWLINSMNIPVRRGIMGSAILQFSEVTALDPILVVTSLQALVFGLCIVLLGLSIARSNCPGTLYLLVLSPAFFINFWSVDTDGALRKELLIFLAFAVLLFATTRQSLSKAILFISALIFSVAVIGHEGNVFFAPFFVFCYLLIFQRGQIAMPVLIALVVVILAACAVAIVLALRYSNVDDHMLVCQPILDAGVQASICDGAIKALELDLGFFTEATFWMLFSPRILSFLLMYALASISILAIGSYLFDTRTVIWASIGSAFFFLPLYVVAVDWGRWLSFHATAVTFVMLIILSLNPEKWTRTPELSRGPFMALCIFSVIWGCSHFVSVKWGGILWKTVSGVLGLA